MPARKPASLINRHETAAEQAQRAERESAMRPERALPMSAPAALSGHIAAEAAWRRLMRMYGEIEGEIITRMDMDLLLDYCLMVEQVLEMDAMRKSAREIWEQFETQRKELIRHGDMEGACIIATRVLGAFDNVVKLDGRVDRKRALLLQWRQALYMTPRARAGAAPTKKEQTEPLDDLDMLLNDVSTFVNGNGK